ncbi:MAG TPA: response regulator [Daejeonella sp.]
MNVERHVLLADDDMDDQMLFKEAFNSCNTGMSLKTVNDGGAVVRYITTSEHHPSLIVLDYNMPFLSGADVLVTLCQMGINSVPIVMLSTSGHNSEECLRLGASAYFIKPERIVDFQRMTKEILAFARS